MTHFITPGLYPIWVTGHQLGSATYPPMGHSLRSKADNSDPHPLGNPRNCPRDRPRACLRGHFPACEEIHSPVSFTRNSERCGQRSSARGLVRSRHSCSDRRWPCHCHHSPRSSSDRSSRGRLEGRFQDGFPTSSPRDFCGSAASLQLPVCSSQWRKPALAVVSSVQRARRPRTQFPIAALSNRGR